MHYKINFLTNVILRLDFNPVPALQSESKPEFSEKISETYTEVKSRPVEQLKFEWSEKGHVVERQSKGLIWEHEWKGTEGQRKVILISPEYFTIEYFKGTYTHFDDFRKELSKLLSFLLGLYAIPSVNRIGLRFINQIQLKKGNPLDWEGLINKDLATVTKAGLTREMRPVRSMHQLQAIKNDITVLMNYGMHNSEYPSPIARKEFILDYDCYITGELPSSELLTKTTELNEMSEYMFEQSIEDGLRKEMEIIND